MRFLMREMEYERPVASGTFRFEADGQPTGSVESWRFSRALDSYSFLRVELDTHSQRDQEICLYHALLSPDMDMERLKFRYFGSRVEIEGDLQFDDHIVFMNRLISIKMNGEKRRIVEEIPLESEAVLWFESIAGQGLAAAKVAENSQRSLLILEKEMDFASRHGSARFHWGEEESRTVLRQQVAVRPCSISWDKSSVDIWLDEFSWPVSAAYASGITASETAYVRYK
jgi:hypothetical protein